MEEPVDDCPPTETITDLLTPLPKGSMQTSCVDVCTPEDSGQIVPPILTTWPDTPKLEPVTVSNVTPGPVEANVGFIPADPYTHKN